MSDPFFEYFKRERETISSALYGTEPSRYKEYSRLESIELPTPGTISKSLGSLLRARHSTRNFSEQKLLSLEKLSTILHWSIGRFERGKHESRPHPSGGAKYPIEMYVAVQQMSDLEPGAYHYNAKCHVLEVLSKGTKEMIEATTKDAFGYSFLTGAHAVLCLSFVKSRSISKYGALAYKLGLLEAGHVGQNLYLTSEAVGAGCCSLAGGDSESMYRLFGLDGGNEHIVSGLALGEPL